MLHALATGADAEIPENKFINIQARQIRKDNVETFWADLNKQPPFSPIRSGPKAASKPSRQKQFPSSHDCHVIGPGINLRV